MTESSNVPTLFEQARTGDRRSLAQLVSMAERNRHRSELSSFVRSADDGGHIVGISGAPGAGKSTLVGALLDNRRDDPLAVLAIDPSSHLTGGAILGDRVRFSGLATASERFIRSMGSRGESGGVARATGLAADILLACGWPTVIVETVGAGQIEVEIGNLADTVAIVMTPGAGDEIQMMKAGLMEIADIFVLNKCDLPGADRLRNDLEYLLASFAGDWKPPIVECAATRSEGIDALWEAISAHHRFARDSGLFVERRRRRRRAELLHELERKVHDIVAAPSNTALVESIEARLDGGEIDLDEAVSRLFKLF